MYASCMCLYVYWVGPDAGWGLMNVLGGAQHMLLIDLYRVGPDEYRVGPDVCTICRILAKDTKHCA